MTLTPDVIHDTVRRLTACGGPFEVTDRHLAGAAVRAFTNAPLTVADLLNAGRAHGPAEFLVFGEERWTFDRFFCDVDSLAAAFQQDLSVKAGDRIAIAMRNSPDWLITFAAAIQVGAVVVPINSWGSGEELEFTLRNSGAKVLAADLPRTSLVADALATSRITLLLSDIDGGHLPDSTHSMLDIRPIRDLLSTGSNRDYLAVQASPEDAAILMYTSGSTGHPKGVIYRNIAVGQAVMNMFLVGVLSMELGGSTQSRDGAPVEAHLVTVPLFHATGLFSGFLVPCVVGQKVALLRKWDADVAMKVIERERITMLSTVPAILKDLLTHPRFGDYDLSSLSRVAAAGAATPSDLPQLLSDKLGIVVRSSGYGMTETASVCATMSGPIFDLKPLASGILSPIIDLRVVSADGSVLAPTEEGEIHLRGVTVTPGYWGLDDVTRDAFTADGWLRSGDIGRLDDDGFLHITGRIKEIVIRGGENIAPIEIENVAYRHPDIKEAAVFGVADEAMGEELALVCFLQPGSSLTEDELRVHLRSVLPAFKVPKYIAMASDPLPRNASEKIHKLALRRSFVPT